MQLFTISADSSKQRRGKKKLERELYRRRVFFQICTTDGMACIREMPGPTCGVACEGIYADVTKRQLKTSPHLCSEFQGR